MNDSVSGSSLTRGQASADRKGGDGRGEEPTNLRSDRMAGSADARELDEDGPWLVGYRVNRINSTALLNGFNPALTDLLRHKRWATLIRDEGWVIPVRYLAHVEKLIDGADVVLFDIDGDPTPGQRNLERETDLARSRALFDEIRAARDAHDPTASHRAYVAASEQLQAKLAELALSRSEGATAV